MLKNSVTDLSLAEAAQDHQDTGVQQAGAPGPLKPEESGDEPLSYASPPCYLAEFSDADFGGQTSK